MFVILSLSYMVVFLQGVGMTVFAKDLMRDMNLSPVGMGMLGSAYLYAYAPVMLFSGMIAAWLGPRKTLFSLYALSGVGGLVFAYSDSLYTAMLGRALCGVGLSATMTSAFTLFGRWYSSKKLSRITASFFAVGGFGSLLGISIMPLLNAWVGWRGSFFGVAVMTLFYSACLWLFVRDWPPEEQESKTDSVRVTKSDGGARELFRDLRLVAKTGDFWRLVMFFIALPGGYFAFNGLWATPYLKDVYAFSDAETGVMVAMGSWGFILGIPFCTWLAEKVLYSNRLVMAGSGVLALLCMGALIWRIDSLGRGGVYAIMILLGMAFNAPNANAYAAMRRLYGPRMAGVTGGALGCTGFIGGAATQIVCGRLLLYAQDNGWEIGPSYALAFSVFLVSCALATIASMALSRRADPPR